MKCTDAIRFLAAILTLALLALPAIHSSAYAAESSALYIRVNQVGYERGAASRAYLMAREPLNHIRFRIQDAEGKTVFMGSSGTQLGTWGHFSVYPIDFAVTNAGEFTIVTEGEQSARSVRFKIDDADDLYKQALRNALSYYQDSRDGANFIPSALRTAPGHLNDARARVYLPAKYDSNDTLISDLIPTGAKIDASGGWWDAGDYVKFVETHSYVVDLMLVGVRDFPAQMGPKARNSDFTAEARFGLEWLGRMWDDRSRTLYYQVGLGNGNNNDILADHDIWRLPQEDDTYAGTDPVYKFVRHRPVLRAARSGSKISPNLAGRLAAAFALGAQVFEDSDPAFARESLRRAQHIFDLADTAPNGPLLTASPFDSYPETEWRDDMELGATEIYLAMKSLHVEDEGDGLKPPGHYLSAAAHWAHEYIHGPNDASDSLNLYDVSGLAHFELVRAIAGSEEGDESVDGPRLEVSRDDLVGDLKKELQAAIAQSERDPFQYGFVWNVSDSATHGAGLAVMAEEYAMLTGSRAFHQYSRRWAANILGANAWGTSFIVGDGSVFPDCMQHQVANLVGSLNGSEPRLNGALVEGPNSAGSTGLVSGMIACPVDGRDRFAPFNGNGSVFVDDVQSYATVEPAIDLTAASFLMFSWRSHPISEPVEHERADE